MKRRGLIAINNHNVTHAPQRGLETFGTPCAIPDCVEYARHRVHLLGADVNLCTKHFSMMFELPPNRQQPKARKRRQDQQRGSERTLWTLKRNMAAPLSFRGKRVECFSADDRDWMWYITLYVKEQGGVSSSGSDARFVMSVARILKSDNRLAMHLVTEVDDIDTMATHLTDMLKYMENRHEMDDDSKLLLGSAATSFLADAARIVRKQLRD